MADLDMDGQAADNAVESPKVISFQHEVTDGEAADVSEKAAKTPQELAIAIRRYLKLGKSRKEVCALENVTDRQFRYAVTLLGKYPAKNEEAFGQWLIGTQAQMDDVEEDLQTARRMGDLKVLAGLNRVLKDLRDSIPDMAMKMGVSYRPPVKLDVTERKAYEVGFGDEETKPKWPERVQ